MTAKESHQEWLAAQNAALMTEVARMYYVIEMLRVNHPEAVDVFERSWELKQENETENT